MTPSLSLKRSDMALV